MKLVLCLTAANESEIQDQLAQSRGLAYDYLEFRADYFLKGTAPDRLPSAIGAINKAIHPRPLILTLRLAGEGGVDPGLDQATKKSLLEVVLAPDQATLPGLIDLEWAMDEEVRKELSQKAHRLGISLIYSHHSFDRALPSDEVEALFLAMAGEADFQKVVSMVKSPGDLEAMEEGLTRARRKALAIRPILIGMGEAGRKSRLPLSDNPSLWTFGFLEKESAPGQIDAGTLSQLIYKNFNA